MNEYFSNMDPNTKMLLEPAAFGAGGFLLGRANNMSLQGAAAGLIAWYVLTQTSLLKSKKKGDPNKSDQVNDMIASGNTLDLKQRIEDEATKPDMKAKVLIANHDLKRAAAFKAPSISNPVVKSSITIPVTQHNPIRHAPPLRYRPPPFWQKSQYANQYFIRSSY